jgi:SAM-dependent methyltransferase
MGMDVAMNHFIHGVARAVAETFGLPGPILEVGSYQVDGQEEIAELRRLFPNRAYTGIDMRPGPGVDQVADVERLPYRDASIGTVLALNTFEHVPRFWKGFAEIARVLRPDGALLVACPFYFRIHNHPGDYWRFTPMALQALLADYPHKIVGWHGPKNRPAEVWSLAFKPGRPPIGDADFERYRALMNRYAREPLSFIRTWSFRLASLFVGRKPFAPYLDQNRWESVCLNQPVQACRIATSPTRMTEMARS